MPTILLTGASGVVGSVLLERLSGDHRVICLTHRRVPELAAEHVRGDLAKPGLGLDRRTRRTLAADVDVVVHAAAVTDFSADARTTRDLNVSGTRNVADFTAEANAVLHHISTAFVGRTDLVRTDVGEARADPVDYLESKRAAEEVLRDGGTPGTIVRPSIVIGDSRTGEIAKFQGLHGLMWAVVKNALPLVPLPPDSRVDFVPQDLLGDGVAALIDHDISSGEYWVTAGDAALTASRIVDLLCEFGGGLGYDTCPPRMVDPGMVDRLIRPVFIDPLPPSARRRFDDMVAMTALFAGARPFPCAWPAGCARLGEEQLDEALARSIEHLARTKRRTERRAA